jgi:hypothetical protein
MAKKAYPKTKSGTLLHRIGLWATVWWAVSGLYFVLLFWLARDFYARFSLVSHGFWPDWRDALWSEFYDNPFMPALLGFIFIIWVLMGYIWIHELKAKKISYKLAFKDLFLTIRR